jgi:putative acetyltransferase
MSSPPLAAEVLRARSFCELQRRAVEFHYRTIRTETGNRQPEAISLYEDSGFCRVLPFGSHANDPVSIFLEKTLSS